MAEMTAGAFKEEQIIQVERLILNTLNFELTVVSPDDFIMRFLRAGQADSDLLAINMAYVRRGHACYQMMNLFLLVLTCLQHTTSVPY